MNSAKIYTGVEAPLHSNLNEIVLRPPDVSYLLPYMTLHACCK